MPEEKQRIAVLGSTGSIGTSCLDVVRSHSDLMAVEVLTAHTGWQELAKQAEEFSPRRVILTGCTSSELPGNAFPRDTELQFGESALADVVTSANVDVVITGIVGAAGLRGTWAAIEAGKRIGVANKETLVVAGPLVMREAKRCNATLIPVDSEHSAIFQAIECGQKDQVQRIILTASGGPFRTWSAEKISTATAENALSHPTWDMGPKITVDSATMMNKALEVIEARWLFEMPANRIDVVVHPQSVVHSMVEFVDGSVIAQLSPPDMKLPIQYAITWPDRVEGISPKLDLSQTFSLDFEPPDLERFPALTLGFEVAERGGTAGAVLNAANEIAVESFLDGNIQLNEIPRLCRAVLDAHDFESQPSLERLLELDHWARQEALNWTSSTSLPSPSSASRRS